MEIEIGSVG